ncbi:MAG TPA: phage tail protein [Pyrinomonadaceae bacterium]|nr:phage tail protein [Pyrinomonadaceae bacterium]
MKKHLMSLKPSYSQFNFLVDLGHAGVHAVDAGFQECSLVDRNEKAALLAGTGTLTLKRGIINRLSLSRWLEEDKSNKLARRTVVVWLQDENHRPLQKWKLEKARITKHVSGSLNAKGTDIAMEELVLAYERLDTDD